MIPKFTPYNMGNHILILIYGVLGRSLRFTHKNHHENIFQPLSDLGINYSITYINNNIENTLIDGLPQDCNYMKIVKDNQYIEMRQKAVDIEIVKRYPNYSQLFKSKNIALKNLNPARNSFIETVVADYLVDYQHSKGYKKVIAFCSDNYFGKKLHKQYLTEDKNIILCSDSNPAIGGITNGFYIGNPLNISRLISSFCILHKRFFGYENILQHNAARYKLSIKVIPFRFIKIRNNKTTSYSQRNSLPFKKNKDIILKFKNEQNDT